MRSARPKSRPERRMRRAGIGPSAPSSDEAHSKRLRRLAVDHRRHPVRCVARCSGFVRLPLEVVNDGRRGEPPAVIQAVHIDDCARSERGLRDCRDEYTAMAADQKIAGSGPEAVILYERPIICPNLEYPLRVSNYAWAVTTAERARARAERTVFRRLRQPKTHMQITAVTPAGMLHAAEYPGSTRGVNRALLTIPHRVGPRAGAQPSRAALRREYKDVRRLRVMRALIDEQIAAMREPRVVGTVRLQAFSPYVLHRSLAYRTNPDNIYGRHKVVAI